MNALGLYIWARFGSAVPPPPGAFTYFRPGGVDRYLRPGGVDTYLRN